jgi:hypothetical protein
VYCYGRVREEVGGYFRRQGYASSRLRSLQSPDANVGAEQGQGGQQGRDAQQGGCETSGVSIQQVPERLNSYLPWLLAGALAVRFAFLGFLLWNKKVVTVTWDVMTVQRRSLVIIL